MHEARPQALLPVLFYLSALFLGRRLFPPVKQHSQHAAAGGSIRLIHSIMLLLPPGLGDAGVAGRILLTLRIG